MIESIDFSLMSPEMIKKMAAVEIQRPELYDNDGYPLEGGIMDPRLGVIDPGLRCKTCGQGVANCMGHFGFIQLTKPIINVLYIKTIYKILKMTCRHCGYVISKTATTTIKKCPNCGADKGKIVFEKPYSFYEESKPLTPLDIREWFEKIPDDQLKLLGIKGGRPEWLILTLLPVPPVIMRPSITLETGERSEDDLTHKLVDIIRINRRLRENIEIGAPEFIIEDLWELLQYHVSTFFDNNLSGVPQARHRSGRALKTLADRLKSKEGRFRHNLTGKRVNFSARSVVSPDPCISIDEVGVPLVIAKELTVPVAVHKNNIKDMRELVLNYPTYPSANYVIRPDGKKKKITEENKEEIANELEPGYTVERHLVNGDIVLFNRQPSLHRMSIMAHRARITPWKTFTLNICVCAPYNADFDGDEMNLHVLQTEEARVEADMLMEVNKNIRTPRYGGAIIGLEHDQISGLAMLTRENVKIGRREVFRLLRDIGYEGEIPSKKTFSGKEIFSLLLPKGLWMEFKSKSNEEGGLVVIENGKLVKGIIDKAAVRRETGKLTSLIEYEYGADVAHKFIDQASKLGIRYLDKVGFTVGIDNFDLDEDHRNQINKMIEIAKKKVENLIEDYKNNKIKLIPGRTMKESLEFYIMKELSSVSENAGNLIEKTIKNNCATLMATSGARGSMTHITQLSALVGQTRVLGERIHRGYTDRTLSHFKPGYLTADAHGFISNSFKTGLNPFEFFFDVMSGRGSLMDKSLRTRHSGYLERRLMNALQDLKVEDDLTVRDNRNMIIQFIAGEDSLDPAKTNWGKLDIEAIIRSIKR